MHKGTNSSPDWIRKCRAGIVKNQRTITKPPSVLEEVDWRAKPHWVLLNGQHDNAYCTLITGSAGVSQSERAKSTATCSISCFVFTFAQPKESNLHCLLMLMSLAESMSKCVFTPELKEPTTTNTNRVQAVVCVSVNVWNAQQVSIWNIPLLTCQATRDQNSSICIRMKHLCLVLLTV